MSENAGKKNTSAEYQVSEAAKTPSLKITKFSPLSVYKKSSNRCKEEETRDQAYP
jgi:hypothetical protein